MISVPKLHTLAKSLIGKAQIYLFLWIQQILKLHMISSLTLLSRSLYRYAVDFGNGEKSVLKHASTYLEPQISEELLDVLVDTQFRVVYQTYDWGLNH